jgi:very-short-patch-repair endonuclease
MIKYYQDLGYDAKHNQPLLVKVKDLPKGSDAQVELLCDYCGEEIVPLPYHRYYTRISNGEKIACSKCVGLKMREKCREKYGVDNVSQIKDVQIKREKTFRSHYGVSNPLKSKEIREKLSQTILDIYGVNNVSQLESVKQRKAQTVLEHYGVDNPAKCEKVKEKIRNTNLLKYGVPHTQQSPEVRAKMNETLCKNGTQKTSRQQLYLHSLYGGKINHAISHYAVDICFTEEKLVIEYDGGGHDLRVTLGRLTQEEFNKREVIRNVVIKREGYKQMKIISKTDKLPQDQILLQMLSEAKQYFSETAHSWMIYDIDNSRMINAENKDTNGIPYSFGELRKIKDSDLPEIENNNNTNLKGA